MSRGRTVLAVLCTMVIVAVSGCRYEGPTSLPLPANTAAGDDPYRVTVIFDSVSNLEKNGSCRANEVPVGHIESISLTENQQARVVCLINKDTALPTNSVGKLSETGVLGERFLALGPASGEQPEGELAPGSVIDASGNRTQPNVEQVLGALSAVLNGGQLHQVRTITQELNAAFSGREGEVREVLNQLGTLTEGLNNNRDDITRALEQLDELSGILSGQRESISDAVEAVPSGLEVLNRQRPRLTQLLEELTHLSGVATPLIEDAKDDATASLELLRPILAELSESADDLAESLYILLSFPFGGDALSAMQGDYFGFGATVNLSMDTINSLLEDTLGAQGEGGSGRGGPQIPDPELPEPELPDSLLPELLEPESSDAGEAGLDLEDLLGGGG